MRNQLCAQQLTGVYNAKGELANYTYPDGTAVGRSYTARGELYQLTHAGTTIDTRVYDNGGRMTSSSTVSRENRRNQSFFLHRSKRISRTVKNNGVSETRAYGTDNTLASIGFAGASIGNLTYGWDANKNKTSQAIAGTMSKNGFTVPTNGYDSEDRLVGFNRTSGLTQSWNLSPVGDWNSVTYSAYGVPTITNASGTMLPVGSVDNRYLYTGREWDPVLAQHHYRARTYDSQLGQFSSRDPIGYADSLALYEYGSSNSLANVDPSGTTWIGDKKVYLPLCIRWLFIPIMDMDDGYYLRERDCAIKTYRGAIAVLKQKISECCAKYSLLCDLELDYKFILDPLRGPGGKMADNPGFPRPLIAAYNMECRYAGLKVLIVGTNPGEIFNGGDSEAVDGGSVCSIAATCEPSRKLAHELGHCGRYRAKPGTEDPKDSRHCNIAGHIMKPFGGSGIDQNWCESIARLAKQNGRSRKQTGRQKPSVIPY